MTPYNPYDNTTPFTSVDPATPTPTTPPTPTPTTPPPIPTSPPTTIPENYTGPADVKVVIIDPTTMLPIKTLIGDKGITVPWRINDDCTIIQLNPMIIEKPGINEDVPLGQDPPSPLPVITETYNFGDLKTPPTNNDEKYLELLALSTRALIIETLDPSIQNPKDLYYRTIWTVNPNPGPPIPPVTPIKNTTDDLIKDQKARQKEELNRRIASLKVTIDMRNAQKAVLQKELKKKDAELTECKKAWLSLFPDYCRQLILDYNKLFREIDSIIKNNAADSKQMKDFQDKLDAIK